MLVQHNKPDGTRCHVLGKAGQSCLHCGAHVPHPAEKPPVDIDTFREKLAPTPTSTVGKMRADAERLQIQCTCKLSGSCKFCKQAKVLRGSINEFQAACEHNEIDEDPTNPFDGICKECEEEGFALVDEFNPLGHDDPEHEPDRQDWRVTMAAVRLYLSNEDLVTELVRRGGQVNDFKFMSNEGRMLVLPKTEYNAPEKPPVLTDPCPHPVRNGHHELYVDPNRRGKGGKMATVCHACGARGFV